jgi:Rrf2 family protein
MLRLSKETEYAIVLLRLFLTGTSTSVRSARDLADESSLPRPTVARILKRLARNGILDSHRGTRGGYEAAVDCREVTVAAVVRAMQGQIALTTCGGTGHGDCLLAGGCPVVAPLHRVTQAIRAALEDLTLGELFGSDALAEPEAPVAPSEP